MTTGSALPMQNDQMSVSSSMTPNSGPQRSHLTDTNQGSSTGGWVAGKNEKGEWIMINFAKPMIIDGITTKGQAGQPYWIIILIQSKTLDNVFPFMATKKISE
jgi:hypothetical protein